MASSFSHLSLLSPRDGLFFLSSLSLLSPRDGRLLLERKPDVVQPVDQAVLAERVHLLAHQDHVYAHSLTYTHIQDDVQCTGKWSGGPLAERARLVARHAHSAAYPPIRHEMHDVQGNGAAVLAERVCLFGHTGHIQGCAHNTTRPPIRYDMHRKGAAFPCGTRPSGRAHTIYARIRAQHSTSKAICKVHGHAVCAAVACLLDDYDCSRCNGTNTGIAGWPRAEGSRRRDA